MKRKITIFAVLGFIIFFAIEPQAADWKLYETEVNGDGHYYDSQSINRVSKDIVRVWIKTVYTVKGAQEWTEKYGFIYKEVSYDLCLYEFNCNEKKERHLSLTYYNKDGEVIENPNCSDSWIFIPPESTVEPLFNIVCKP